MLGFFMQILVFCLMGYTASLLAPQFGFASVVWWHVALGIWASLKLTEMLVRVVRR